VPLALFSEGLEQEFFWLIYEEIHDANEAID
jgi:hypothetical protein